MFGDCLCTPKTSRTQSNEHNRYHSLVHISLTYDRQRSFTQIVEDDLSLQNTRGGFLRTGYTVHEEGVTRDRAALGWKYFSTWR